MECSFETCSQRDVKGLYRRAKSGSVSHFTGKDSAFEPPLHSDLILNTEKTSVEQSSEELFQFVLKHVKPLS